MKKIIVMLLIFTTITNTNLIAQTWNGTLSSDWNTAANWIPNNVPGTSSSVIINNAAATYQPALAGNVSVSSINMSRGILNLNGFTLTCSGHAIFTGDSLLNGKVTAYTFDNVSNMHMGGKIILEKTGPANESWAGNNKVYGDSLIIIWRWGALHLENVALSPDSIFGNLKIQFADNYSNNAVQFSDLSNLYVQNNFILDNEGYGTFILLNSSHSTIIGGNLVGLNFSSETTPNLVLKNITTLGTNANGPFYSQTASINNCNFKGNFMLAADSNITVAIHNSSFLGTDNLLQAGNLDVYGNRFGSSGSGLTILRAAHNLTYSVLMRTGNNKFIGDVQWETFAAYPGGITMQHNWYGADTSLQNLRFILKGNSALSTNNNGHNYVAGNVIIDGQGTRKWIEFLGGTGNDFNVVGNFTVKNFTPFSETGVGNTNVHLRNLFVTGTDTVGTFYCYTGDINNCSFKGNIKLIADSSQAYTIYNSSLLGTDNLFQAGNLDVQNNRFGKIGEGATILRAAHNLGYNVYMRDGNNKFLGNAQWETYALNPGGLTIQQTFFGADSCFGNMNFILKGNSALTTNGSGNSYVAGNVIIDGQGARKWVQFTGSAGVSFNVVGNFTVKNFTPFSETGVGNTNVHLRNLFVTGTDTVGTFYCYTGDINNCSFKGNIKLIADSSQAYTIYNSSLLGTDNLFQAGNFDIQNNRFGQLGGGATIFRAAHNFGYNVYLRDGNNKFFGDAQWIAIAPPLGSTLIQQTFFGADSCMGNLLINVEGAASANLGGSNLYIGKGLSLQNNGSGTIVHDNGGTAIYFIGADTSNYSYSGSGSAPSLQNIGINRRGGLRLMSPLTCSGLILTRGIILSSSTNQLQMPNIAVVAGGGDSSYVDGPMKKTGNTEFTFPLGKNNVYAPIGITAPSAANDAFSAQYFNTNPGIVYDSTQHDVSLNHISRSEYWLLNRTNGTATPKVTLSWNANRSGPVNVINDLRIARWDGIAWKDEGYGNTTGTNEEGTIQSLNNISNFSPFTLASSSVNNVLPVNFILFKLTLNASNVILLQWKTSGEINVASYVVERSTDGRNWIKIATVFPVSLHQYDYADNASAAELYYYRIKQVDTDGSYRYSIVRVIKLNGGTSLSIWPNPITNTLYIQSNFSQGRFEITDVSGKIIRKEIINKTLTIIPVQQLAKGVYTIRIYYNEGMFIEKFIKQ